MIDKQKFLELNPVDDPKVHQLFSHMMVNHKETGDDAHQLILNLGYEEWQDRDNNRKDGDPSWGYEEMLDWVEQTYGRIARLMIQMGKYNQQVCNGGHHQYYNNGYASNGGGCMDYHGDSCELHDHMDAAFEKYIFPAVSDIPEMEKLKVLLKKFRVELDDERMITETCDTCNGRGYHNEWDEESEEYWDEECPDCYNGQVEYENDEYGQPVNHHEWEQMDTEYYEISDKIMEILNALCEMSVGTDGLKTFKTKEDE